MLRVLSLALLLSAQAAFGQSLEAVRAAAAQGSAEAQTELANRYRDGTGLLQSYARAALWYSKAAEQGDPQAMHGLARLLFSGVGINADPGAALALLTTAAQDGDPEALLDLGSALELGLAAAPDPEKAAAAYQLAADKGFDPAAVALGFLYQNGVGVSQDIPRAISLYTGPAKRGDAKAQNNLGLIYARGHGVAQDYGAAYRYFEQAASAGLPEGLRNLAALYANGFGVAVDEAKSDALLRAAAQRGEAIAFFHDPRLLAPTLDQIETYAVGATNGDPVASYSYAMLVTASAGASGAEFAQAGRAFQQAAAKGLPAAMANYGLMKFQGRGVLQDFVEGHAWLTVAASLGLKEALEVRDRFGAALTAEQLNAAQARAEVIWQETTGQVPR